MSLKIFDGALEDYRIIFRPAQCAVAVETHDPSDLSSDMVVVDVLRQPILANRARAVLLDDRLSNDRLVNAIPQFQKVVLMTSVSPLL